MYIVIYIMYNNYYVNTYYAILLLNIVVNMLSIFAARLIKDTELSFSLLQ